MPGIVAQPWDFNIDGPRATIRKGSSHDALVTFMYNAPAYGEWSMTWIERELSLSKEGAKYLRVVLANPSSHLSQRLAALGVKSRPKAPPGRSEQTSSSARSSR